MKKYLIVCGLFNLIACSNHEDSSLNSVNKQLEDTLKEEVEKVQGDTIISLVPNYGSFFNTDTILKHHRIKISTIDTKDYVTIQYSSEDKYFVDRYFDKQFKLSISNRGENIVDTIIKKSSFEILLNEDFYQQANFHGYWFREFRKDTLTFFGVIGKPETDWSYAFYHHYIIPIDTLIIEEYEEESF